MIKNTPQGAQVIGIALAQQAAHAAVSQSRSPVRQEWPHQALANAGKTSQEEKRASFRASNTGKHLKQIDQALPGTHTRKLYDALDQEQAATLTQMRTGYCRLNQYLHRINAAENDKCRCGETETVHHFILHCPRWTRDREMLVEAVGPRAGQLAYLLGGYQGEELDGPLQKWSPDLKVIRHTITFVQATGRLQEQS